MGLKSLISKGAAASKWMRASCAVLGMVALSACQVTAPSVGGNGGASVNRNTPTQVALLVPYGSGRAGDDVVARSLENAARLAIADLDGVPIELRVYNTAGNAGQAAAVAKRAVEEGAQVILGPLFGDAAGAAGAAVAGSDVSVLSFSNNTAIAGGNVYVLGNTYENTASRMMRFAASQGRNRVLVMHARNTTGEVAKDAVQRAAQGSGATITGVVSYEFSQTGVVGAVPSIVSTARSTGTNAVFMTSDSAGALPLFAQLLPEAGLGADTVKFIGLTRWDVPPQTLELTGLQGGWFAIPDPTLTAQFNARYSTAYGDAPHPLAGLAYDGIAAVGAIVKGGATKLGAAELTQASGFAGVNGVFRLRSDGTNQRALAVAQIVNRTVQVISPAPRSFGLAGF